MSLKPKPAKQPKRKKLTYQYSELVTVSLPTGKKSHYSRRQVTRQGKGRLLATFDVKNKNAFLLEVVNDKKIMLIGSTDELRKIS